MLIYLGGCGKGNAPSGTGANNEHICILNGVWVGRRHDHICSDSDRRARRRDGRTLKDEASSFSMTQDSPLALAPASSASPTLHHATSYPRPSQARDVALGRSFFFPQCQLMHTVDAGRVGPLGALSIVEGVQEPQGLILMFMTSHLLAASGPLGMCWPAAFKPFCVGPGDRAA